MQLESWKKIDIPSVSVILNSFDTENHKLANEMKKRIILWLVVVASVVLVRGIILPALTGLPLIRKTVVDKLTAPVQIHDLRSDGLVTTDGRIVTLRFVKTTPVTNAIFAAATSHGIEIGDNGTAVGLIDVHHWCGNDPVGKHLGRVDLAALALYLGAEPSEDLPELLAGLGGRTITRDRIDPGDYRSIQTMAKIMAMKSPTLDAKPISLSSNH